MSYAGSSTIAASEANPALPHNMSALNPLQEHICKYMTLLFENQVSEKDLAVVSDKIAFLVRNVFGTELDGLDPARVQVLYINNNIIIPTNDAGRPNIISGKKLAVVVTHGNKSMTVFEADQRQETTTHFIGDLANRLDNKIMELLKEDGPMIDLSAL